MRDTVLDLCVDLGIIVNLEKSLLTPSQVVAYLRVRIDSQTFRASPTPMRIEKFFSIIEEFLSSRGQSAKFWRVLLGQPASLIHLVPGGRLRVRSLQLCLRTQWDFLDDSQIIWWDAFSQEDLLWWCEEGHLEEGESHHPDLMFWSDASDQGWGATACDQVALGRWGVDEVGLSINVRVVGDREGFPCVSPFSKRSVGCGVQRQHYGSELYSAPRGHSVAEVGSDCSVPSSLGGITGDRAPSPICHGEVQCSGRLPLEAQSDRWVRVDASPSGVRISAEAVVGDGGLICHLTKLRVYFAPMSDPMAAGTDAMLQNWDHLQAYAFPPVAMLHQVLNKIRASVGAQVTLIAPFWPSKEWFLLSLLTEPPVPLPQRWDLLRQPHIRKFHQCLSWLHLHA